MNGLREVRADLCALRSDTRVAGPQPHRPVRRSISGAAAWRPRSSTLPDDRRRCGERWRVSDSRPALLYVGRLSPGKGPGPAGAAHRALNDTGTPHRLVLVGDGPMQQELRAPAPTPCSPARFPPTRSPWRWRRPTSSCSPAAPTRQATWCSKRRPAACPSSSPIRAVRARTCGRARQDSSVVTCQTSFTARPRCCAPPSQCRRRAARSAPSRSGQQQRLTVCAGQKERARKEHVDPHRAASDVGVPVERDDLPEHDHENEIAHSRRSTRRAGACGPEE